MSRLVEFLSGLPPAVIYLTLGAGAAVENIIPPVPADTFVILGGFIAAIGRADPWGVFAITWGANVTSALVVYGLGHRLGRPFFRTRLGRRLLNRRQLHRLRRFYDLWGMPAIFLSRFLPGLRAVVPVFAGISHQRFLPVLLPIATASAIWYGTLVWLGTVAGRNLDRIVALVGGANRLLLVLSLFVTTVIAVWWIRTRKRRSPHANARLRGDPEEPLPHANARWRGDPEEPRPDRAPADSEGRDKGVTR